MKACVIQPHYSMNPADTERCFSEMVALLDQCDDSLDLIVLPEYSDIPAAQPDKAAFDASMEKYSDLILAKAKAAALRTNAVVFVNAGTRTEQGWRNTTHAIDRSGRVVGRYFKAHPAPSEVKTAAQGGNGMDVQYSYDRRDPYVVEIDGIRYGFMTCYDFYFYESFAQLARQKVDVIIGCSHQRTDTHQALSIINRFLCYNTNAYLVRASISLGEDSPICGCSCIIAPDGTVLADMESRVGLAVAEFDPHQKYLKPAGFRGAMKSHPDYIEEGRRPWLYRNGGAAMMPADAELGYPRLCAHRGLNTVAPENSLPAFGAAISLGAEEIEFDLWPTADGEIVSCHDNCLDRVSDGTGLVYEKTLAELQQLDFGERFSPELKGLRVVQFEDILQKFAGQVIMNIHLKTISADSEYPEDVLRKIVALIDRYDCRRHVYFMTGNGPLLELLRRVCPDIRRCCGTDESSPAAKWALVDRAIEYGCCKVQLIKPYFNQEMIDKAHAHGIRCNVFFANDVDEAAAFLDMGVDTILTDHYMKLSTGLKAKDCLPRK